MSRDKIARWFPLAGAMLLLAAVGVLAQQARPFSAVYQRPFSQQGFSPGFGAGTALPTLANSNLAPQDAELYVLVTAPVSADPILQMYSGNASAWRPFLFSTLATNEIDVANSVWFASSAIVAEGTTADDYELTLGFPDLPGDVVLDFLDKPAAITSGYVLDTGVDPAVTAEVPDREWAPAVTTYPRDKVWFRVAPSYASGPVTTGVVSACSTGAAMNYIYGPAITGYGFEQDMKGTVTACGPSYVAADGMGLHTDAGTANEGWELTQGIVDGSPGAFTVGVSPAFYASVRVAIANVDETDLCGFGFRKAEAYQDAAMVNYADYFGIFIGDNGDSGDGDFYVYEEIGGASAAATDLAEADWTDNQVHTLEVRISAAGVATAYIEGTLVEDAGTAYTFTDALVLVPYFWCIDDSTTNDPDVDFVFWETGIQ